MEPFLIFSMLVPGSLLCIVCDGTSMILNVHYCQFASKAPIASFTWLHHISSTSWCWTCFFSQPNRNMTKLRQWAVTNTDPWDLGELSWLAVAKSQAAKKKAPPKSCAWDERCLHWGSGDFRLVYLSVSYLIHISSMSAKLIHLIIENYDLELKSSKSHYSHNESPCQRSQQYILKAETQLEGGLHPSFGFVQLR